MISKTSPEYTEAYNWIKNTVVDLNLCPFARKPLIEDKVKIVVEESKDLQNVMSCLIAELEYLDTNPAEMVETTVLVLTNALASFEDYLEFFDIANDVLVKLGLEGELQIASFHPDYVFEGVDTDDQSNYTNRSPYPVFHLIREASLEEVIEKYKNVDQIPEKNIELLRSFTNEQLNKYFPHRLKGATNADK